MEIRLSCRKCGAVWDGGLHDDMCPVCQSVDARLISTDESYDYEDIDEDFEEEENDE